MAKVSASGRSAGLLLHPTSLPGPFGIGDLGPAAFRWVDLLAKGLQKWWQILPLGPTGFGDSPYQSFSAFAGNPLLVSPERLLEDNLISERDLFGAQFRADRVDFGPVIQFKNHLLDRAWETFRSGRVFGLKPGFEHFQQAQGHWLNDYALFMALKDAQGGRPWYDWPEPLRRRQPDALGTARGQLANAVQAYKFRQFLFFRQWLEVKHYAHDHRIQMIGDMPIFVSADSADVWSQPDLFQLNPDRRPRVVAGVPPDYFSATGQLWGNPLYDWDALQRTRFAWWVDRLKATLLLVDVVRLDHFRGFEAYWEIPADRPDATEGRWVQAPGAALFETFRKELGGLPIIAEDLGIITEEVDALRERFHLPGMRVLQFAFGDKPTNPYLPHNYTRQTVAYTGTHDNDTTRGWYATATEKEKDDVRRYLVRDGHDIAWDFIRAAWGSVADYAIAPLQDVLNLGSEGRMNTPGQPAGNWSWPFPQHLIHDGLVHRLAEMTTLYGRAPSPPAG